MIFQGKPGMKGEQGSIGLPGHPGARVSSIPLSACSFNTLYLSRLTFHMLHFTAKISNIYFVSADS